jgi:hypothetical protein
MEVGGQFQAPVDLFREKEPPLPIRQEAEWAPEPVWTLWSGDSAVFLFAGHTLQLSVHPSIFFLFVKTL